jgi:hypothetical protein
MRLTRVGDRTGGRETYFIAAGRDQVRLFSWGEDGLEAGGGHGWLVGKKWWWSTGLLVGDLCSWYYLPAQDVTRIPTPTSGSELQ